MQPRAQQRPIPSTCSLLSIVRNHLPDVMKLVEDKIKYYDLQEVTKCLNTAVVVAALYIGENADQFTKQCDVSKVRSDYTNMVGNVRKKNQGSKFDPSLYYLRLLKKDLSSRTPPSASSERYIYYIMITDSSKISFPGHVFVVERYSDDTLYIYQSYINNYTLQEYYEKNNKSFKISREKLLYFLTEMEDVFSRGTWTKKTTIAWKQLTQVSSPEFEGVVFKGRVSLCYRKIKVNDCTATLEMLIENRLASRTLPLSAQDERRLRTILEQVKAVGKTFSSKI